MTTNKFATLLAKLDDGRSEANIGDIRQIIKYQKQILGPKFNQLIEETSEEELSAAIQKKLKAYKKK